MSQPTVHPEVVLGLPTKPLDRANSAAAIVNAMAGSFPSAATQVAAAKTAVAAYSTAVDNIRNKVPGGVGVRSDAQLAMMKTLVVLLAIVQAAVDAAPAQAATLATSAAMRLRKPSARTKEAFAVKDGPNSGQAHLIAKALVGALLYFWEFSLDGKTWTVAPDTSAANSILTGLTVGQTYSFRFHARLRKTGMSDYSQILTHTVR
jgi:hypothetical protein